MACGWAMWARVWHALGTHHAHTRCPDKGGARPAWPRGCLCGGSARGALSVDNMPHVSHHHLHTDNAHHAPPRPHHRVCVDGPVRTRHTTAWPCTHTHTHIHGVARRGAAPPPAHHHHTHLHAWQHACGAAQSTGAAPPRQRACHANTVCGEAMVHHLTHKCSSAHLVANNPTPWARRGSARVLPRQRRV